MKELIIAADVHVAKVWDEVAKEDPNAVRPNENFKKLVSKVKKDQTLILNGDLVDYYYQEYSKPKKRNWDIFFDILSDCKGKYYCNTGNHDYRKMPYNFFLHGMWHVNSHVNKLKNINFRKFRWFGELSSIAVGKSWFDALRDYPFDEYYSAEHSDFKLIFLNSGHDSIFYLGPFLIPLHKDPRTVGIDKHQINFLKKELKTAKKDVIIFTHAPLIFSYDPIQKHSVDKLGMRAETFLFNRKLFLETLLESDKNIILVSGHTHIPKQYLIDKHKRTVEDSSVSGVNKAFKDPRFIKVLSTPPLGVIRPRCKNTGYISLNKNSIKYHIMNKF